MEVKDKRLECLQCGHRWFPRSQKVFRCANIKCQSFMWDTAKEEGK